MILGHHWVVAHDYLVRAIAALQHGLYTFKICFDWNLFHPHMIVIAYNQMPLAW